MLKPGDREHLVEMLRPPIGYRLDFAVGTTFSLDLVSALLLPLSFAFCDWQKPDGELAADPLARSALVDVMQPDGKEKLTRAVRALEARLRRTIARTERSAVPGSPRMLQEISPPNVPLKEHDVRGYLGAQSIADLIEEGDVIEYWKSSPYLFNFMDDYKLKKSFKAWEQERELIEAVRRHGDCFIDAARLANYQHVDPSNARLRGLIEETVGRGMWRLLWLPPSLRHYELSGPYATPELPNVTKRLVFSAWHMVPRATKETAPECGCSRQAVAAPALRRPGGKGTATAWLRRNSLARRAFA